MAAKTRISILPALAAVAVLGLAGCGNGEAETVGTATDSVTTSESPSPTGSETSPSPTETASATSTSPSSSTSGSSSSAGLNTFRAFGTEPFWEVAVDGTTLKYKDLGLEDQQERTLTATKGGSADAPTYTGSNQGTNFSLTITPGDCSDGMSDNTYPYKAEFRYGERALTGCASA